MGAGDCGLETVDALLAAKRSGDGRHFRVVAVVADTHRDPPGEIDTLDVLEKAVHEVLQRLLAFGDDINPGVFLLLQYQQRRVALRLDQRLTLQLPGRPQHPRLGEPSGLRQAAGDRRLEHVTSPFRLPSSLAPRGDRQQVGPQKLCQIIDVKSVSDATNDGACMTEIAEPRSDDKLLVALWSGK